ncbi:hypothetical protein [Kitasatospora sp. NPDC090091]|uniref:hypothetical protein n=1 Tax=Kitasatospora sp. NPDC090091 TaxID=3364081 RepID=UPI00382E4548
MTTTADPATTLNGVYTDSYAEAFARAQVTEAHAEQLRQQNLVDQRTADITLQLEEAKAKAEIAALNAKAAAENHKADQARLKRQADADAEQAAAHRRAQSATQWRRSALGFAISCAVVALPVQMHAFWNPAQLWLLATPVMLEGGAWVVNRGAAAAVDDHRPHWHYRLISWLLALVAAGINLAHGLETFGVATALATAFASLAGPGVWDLHEHGRIRARDGKPSRAQRRAERVAAKKQAERDAARAKADADRKHAETLAQQALEGEYQKVHPEVYARAVQLRAALSQRVITQRVWERAWYDVTGSSLGDTAESIGARVAAVARAKAAALDPDGQPADGAEVAKNLQVVPQMPPGGAKADKAPGQGPGRGNPHGPPVRGRRTAGDTPEYADGARKQMALAAKQTPNARPQATARITKRSGRK